MNTKQYQKKLKTKKKNLKRSQLCRQFVKLKTEL